jgi:hypothetical protein
MIRILYRPAEVVEGGWQPVGEARTRADASDGISFWNGPRLGHGDLVAVDTNVPNLLVFDGDRGELVEVRDRPRGGWINFWEGEASNPLEMLDKISHGKGSRRAGWKGNLDLRRVVLSACEIAEELLRLGTPNDAANLNTISTTRMWARGKATVADVEKAADISSYSTAQAGSDSLTECLAAVSCAMTVTDQARLRLVVRYSYRNGMSLSEIEKGARVRASIIRRHIPLSVLACAAVGARDPLPLPR